MKTLIAFLLGALVGIGGFVGSVHLFIIRPAEQRMQLAQADLIHQIGADKLPAYDTLDAAAVHAAQNILECSTHYECGGPLAVRPDGKYVAGAVRSDDQGDHVRLNTNVPPPWKLAGTIHSHPCLADTHEVGYFSPDDVGSTITEGVPGYMLDECTGEVHVFDPATDKAGDTYLKDDEIYLTKGRVIGVVKVSGESVEGKRVLK